MGSERDDRARRRFSVNDLRTACATITVVLVAGACTGAGAAALDGDSGPTEDELRAALVVATPLALNHSTVAPGDTLEGTVTYTNKGSRSASMASVVITARPPNGTNAGGPYDDFAPAMVPLTLRGGASITLKAKLTLPPSAPTGEWYAYSTHERPSGTWHDETSARFTVAPRTCAPNSCAALGKDCGAIPDGCGGTLSCGTCAAPKTCGGAGVANVCGEGGSASRFLTRKGKVLYLDGQAYWTVGANAYGMNGDETGDPYSPQILDAYFGALRPRGLTRTWARMHAGSESLVPIVGAAEAHDQLLILSLSDGQANDDDDQHSGNPGKPPSWYAGGYKVKYIPWVREVVARFKDSPAIGMWELINEPGGHNPQGSVSDATMKAFFDDVATLIKSIDPNHLVLSGSGAEYLAGTSDFAYVHSGPNVDVGSLHEYDYDWQGSHTIVSGHLKATLDGMNAVDKPLILGEVGIMASDAGGCTSRSQRRDAFRAKFDAYRAQAVPVVLVWNWHPTKDDSCAYETIYPSDSTMDLLRTY